MKSRTTATVTMSGPKDRSLDAYKDWITEIARRLTTTKEHIKFTEAEWTVHWKEFWKDKYKS